MKRIISAGILSAALLLLTIAAALSKPSAITLPATGNIVQIQLDTVKMDAKNFGEAQIEEFLENMGALTPVTKLASTQVAKPKQDFVLAFLEENGKRKSFRFFFTDGIYYMETEEGDLYKNADFMEEYLAKTSGWLPAPRGVETTPSPNTEALACALDTGYDTRYWLYCTVQKKAAEGYAEGELMERAKAELLWQYQIYQYASENGYGIPDNTYQELTADWLIKNKQSNQSCPVCVGEGRPWFAVRPQKPLYRLPYNAGYSIFHPSFMQGHSFFPIACTAKLRFSLSTLSAWNSRST